MRNEEFAEFNIYTIPKLIESDETESYKNYLTGGVIGGTITFGLSLFFIPKVAILATIGKIVTTVLGIGTGSYILDTNTFNNFEKMKEIQEKSLEKSDKLIRNIDNKNYMYIYDNINNILRNENHPIGNINNKFKQLYIKYEKPTIVLKFHIHQIQNLVIYVYKLDSETYKLKNYILTSIERSICNQIYNYIINIICKMTYENNQQFQKNKNNIQIQKQIYSEIKKYDLNYYVLITMFNNIQNCTTAIDKISCIETISNQISTELKHKNKNMASDELLDILVYIIIKSDIENPYDEIKFIDEYLKDNSNKYGYLLVSFNAATDYIRNI